MTKILSVGLVVFVGFIAFFSSPAISAPARGEFVASKACQAYQSKRKKTNPGEVLTEIGATYSVVEVNVPSGTTWYRLIIPGASPQERWVYFECGNANVTDQDGGQGSACPSTPGLVDSYVFAVSWQPAFCESHKDKPECAVNDPSAYQAKNFTLHGLWPNNDSCNKSYGFCGSTKKVQGSFCNYPKVPMSAETLKVLGKYMPSSAAMSCLQRHEWYKHGTCQTTWDADGYYDTAMRLTKEFNAGVGTFMAANIGESVATQDFFAVINQAFGADAHKRLQLKCKNGLLVDIYVNLPRDQLDSTSLSGLIQAGAQDFSNGCGASFKVDAIGQ